MSSGNRMPVRGGLAPLTGVLFVVLLLTFFAIAPFPPVSTEVSVDEVVNFYVENGDRVFIGVLFQSLSAATFLFFAAVLHKEMRARGAAASAVGLMAGAAVFTVGATLDSTINAAAANSAGMVDAVAVQALTALYEFAYMPAATGMFVFLVGWGAAIVRHGLFPAWTGWVLVAAALLAISTPFFVLGFYVALIVVGLAVLVASVKLTREAVAAPA